MPLKRKRPRLTTTNCKRCSKTITTLNKPIHDSATTRAAWIKYRGICGDCMSFDEREDMQCQMTKGVLESLTRV